MLKWWKSNLALLHVLYSSPLHLPCTSSSPAKGRVEFEDSWLIKSSFITMEEMKACQLTRTKFKKKIVESESSNNQLILQI
jgi:hypothetical protein